MEDGSDIRNAKFCRLDVAGVLRKYDVRRAKRTQRRGSSMSPPKGTEI